MYVGSNVYNQKFRIKGLISSITEPYRNYFYGSGSGSVTRQ